MCTTLKMNCICGKEEVSFHFRNNIFPEEVIEKVYCPEESESIEFNKNKMLNDNGWVIEYDIELAKFIGAKKLEIDPEKITPEFLFDNGYVTWKELFPGEQKQSMAERNRLKELSKVNPKKYFQEIKNWANARMKKFKEEGWRKAQSFA